MKLPKKYQNAVYFANACTNSGMRPVTMAKLSTLAHRAFRAGERSCNEPDFDADPARGRFELLASKSSLTVQWPGLYPECFRADNGHRIVLAVNM